MQAGRKERAGWSCRSWGLGNEKKTRPRKKEEKVENVKSRIGTASSALNPLNAAVRGSGGSLSSSLSCVGGKLMCPCGQSFVGGLVLTGPPLSETWFRIHGSKPTIPTPSPQGVS